MRFLTSYLYISQVKMTEDCDDDSDNEGNDYCKLPWDSYYTYPHISQVMMTDDCDDVSDNYSNDNWTMLWDSSPLYTYRKL